MTVGRPFDGFIAIPRRRRALLQARRAIEADAALTPKERSELLLSNAHELQRMSELRRGKASRTDVFGVLFVAVPFLLADIVLPAGWLPGFVVAEFVVLLGIVLVQRGSRSGAARSAQPAERQPLRLGPAADETEIEKS